MSLAKCLLLSHVYLHHKNYHEFYVKIIIFIALEIFSNGKKIRFMYNITFIFLLIFMIYKYNLLIYIGNRKTY